VRPTRGLGRATLKRPSIWSCTGWGLPSFPGHPGNWCALTAPFHPYRRRPAPEGWPSTAVCFLLHFPSCRHDSMLWSTLPCGVRTFLRSTATGDPTRNCTRALETGEERASSLSPHHRRGVGM
jgi:hypothetical protein